MKPIISILPVVTIIGAAVVCLRENPMISSISDAASGSTFDSDESSSPPHALTRRPARPSYSLSSNTGENPFVTEISGSASPTADETKTSVPRIPNRRPSRSIHHLPSRPEIPSSSLFPAIWIDVPGAIAFTPSQQTTIQQEAESLLGQIDAAGQTGSPASAKAELINTSDLDFRRKYGVRAWLSHHAQANAYFNRQDTR